jgi:hypothetical protein
MNPASEGSLQCPACRRIFSAEHSFNSHQRACKKGKKRLSGALAKAKELWVATKRRRLEEKDDVSACDDPPTDTIESTVRLL